MHEALLLLLDHASSHVSEAACGALINLAADAHTRAPLLGVGAAPRLASLLLAMLSPSLSPSSAEVSTSELGASLLAAKTLCNLCSGCAVNPLGVPLTTPLTVLRSTATSNLT